MKIIIKIMIGFILIFYLYNLLIKYYFVKENKQELNSIASYTEEVGVDYVKIIDDEKEAYDLRFKLLDSAKDNVKIAYYSFEDDEISAYFLAKVLETAKRGVDVTLIYDSYASGAKKALASLASSVKVKEYNHFNPLNPFSVNERMHDKYILVDNTYLLLGGRNIGKRYYDDDKITKDRDVLVKTSDYKKSVIKEVYDYNKEIFNYEKSTLVKGKNSEYLESYLPLIDEKFPNYQTYDLDEGLILTNKVSFLHNSYEASKKEPVLLENLINLANSSKEYLYLQSPYIVLDSRIKKLFEVDTEIEVLTNSLYSSPNLPAFSNYLYVKDDLLKMGVKLNEYNSKDSLHQKAMLVDDNLTVIGSFNLDPRSAYIDTELMLVVDSKEVQASFRKQNEEYLAKAVTYYLDTTSGEALDPGLFKKLCFYVGGFFARFFKPLI